MKIKTKPLKWLLPFFAIVAALPSSCRSNTPIVSRTVVATATLTPQPEFLSPTKLSTSVSGTRQVLLIAQWPENGFPTDATKIMAITLEKNILKIQVVYQGGCQEHIFELYAETAFLQSNPPQGVLYLAHNSHGDICSENVQKMLSFDLTPLNKERNDPSEHPLLLRIFEPVGGSFAKESYMPLIEWP